MIDSMAGQTDWPIVANTPLPNIGCCICIRIKYKKTDWPTVANTLLLFNTSCFHCIFVLVQKIQVCQLFQKKSGLQPTTPGSLSAQSSIFFLISISDEILIHLKIGTFIFPLKEVFLPLKVLECCCSVSKTTGW